MTKWSLVAPRPFCTVELAVIDRRAVPPRLAGALVGIHVRTASLQRRPTSACGLRYDQTH